MLLLLAACTASTPSGGDDSGGDSGPAGPVDIAPPTAGWYRGDLHFHTNYSDDAREQKGDWMGPALAIADAWRAEEWVTAHPEYAATDHLQFVAVTDHRTVDGLSDPDFGHPYLAVLGGEEFGSDGHAGIWGITEHIPHEPQGGEDATTRIQDAIDEAHAVGAAFSVNHPLYAGDLWAWDVTGFDGVEVWNGAWSALASPTTEAELDAWAAGRPENPWIRPAVRAAGVSQNGQALRFWQEVLSSGAHPAPVGGGDRHMIFPAGLPTTYVAASAQTPEAVLAGIQAGHTFVSRGPQGPQVVLEATVGGQVYPMGADLPAGEATIGWRVGRAAGGELRIWTGAPGVEPAVLTTIPLTGADESGELTWAAAPGAWLHAVVVDPLPEPPEELAPTMQAFLVFPDDGGIGALLGAIAPLLDLSVLANPALCSTASWSEWSACCMPVDTEPYGTFYLPPAVQAYMSAEFRDGQPTGFAMGAISAAFLVPTQG